MLQKKSSRALCLGSLERPRRNAEEENPRKEKLPSRAGVTVLCGYAPPEFLYPIHSDD
jgi:hypothetical protein